jgi:integrase
MEYKACDAGTTFRHLYKISGMKGASSHSGRRSYASRLVEFGVDIEDVSRLLGHTGSGLHVDLCVTVEGINTRSI